MRKVIVAGFVAALVVGVLAIPASASFDHHFSVIAKTVSSQRIGKSEVRFKDHLFEPGNQSNRVGRDHGTCRFTHSRGKCKVTAHLDGEIGGRGDLFVHGDISRHDRRLNVVGGTGDFNGVAGKVIRHGRGHRSDKIHFDLVR